MIWSLRLAKTFGIAFSFAIVAYGTLGCRSESPRRERAVPEKVLDLCSMPPDRTAALGGGQGARIVIDISGSMKGFALRESTRLYTLHDVIERATRDALAALEAQPRIDRCYIGEMLDCKKALPLSAMNQAATYSAKESRLDLFFLPPPAPPPGPVAVPPSPPPDPLETYRLSILVTDGMAARASDVSQAGPCLAGADPECMGHLLRQRVQQGYGVWLALLYLPFQGLHFAERPLDESHWERLRQHLLALVHDPYFPGIAFQARRLDLRVPFNTFQFEGVKPLMVLALSRDASVGRRWLAALRSLVEKESLPHPPQGLYTMELAPLDLPTRRVEKFSLDPKGTLKGLRYVVAKRQPTYFDILLECRRDGTGRFLLTATTSPPEASGAPVTPFRWTWRFLEGDFPADRVRLEVAESSDVLQVTCPRFREGHYKAWWALEPQIETGPAAGRGVFWTDLHSDNVYEAPERFYGLRTVVQTVLQEVARRPRVVDCLRIRVEYR